MDRNSSIAHTARICARGTLAYRHGGLSAGASFAARCIETTWLISAPCGNSISEAVAGRPAKQWRSSRHQAYVASAKAASVAAESESGISSAAWRKIASAWRKHGGVSPKGSSASTARRLAKTRSSSAAAAWRIALRAWRSSAAARHALARKHLALSCGWAERGAKLRARPAALL